MPVSRVRQITASKSRSKSLIIGVTGGIGSGKSTVCRLFGARGRIVLSADEIAKRLTATDSRIRSQLSKEFGPTIFLPDGILDRKSLAIRVFQNKSLLKKLNAIIHPHVVKEVQRIIRDLPSASRRPFVVVEAALIYEAHLEAMFDYVVAVDAPLEIRILRATSRHSLSEVEVRNRVQAQLPSEKLTRKADFVIHNHKDEKELERQVTFLDGLFSTLAS